MGEAEPFSGIPMTNGAHMAHTAPGDSMLTRHEVADPLVTLGLSVVFGGPFGTRWGVQ